MAFQSKYTLPFLDDFVMFVRTRAIYNTMLRKDYRKSMHIIKNTIYQIQHASVKEFDYRTLQTMENKLYGALVHMATKRYSEAHNYIRDLHYFMLTAV